MSFCDYQDFLPDGWPYIAGHDFRGRGWTCLKCGVAYVHMSALCQAEPPASTDIDWLAVNRRACGH